MSGQPSVLQVVILRDGLLVGTEVFVPGQYTLGSSDSVDLRLDDPSVAETHATLYFQNGRAAIQDAGSGSVFVNGHRVNACEVRAVDEIACGPFTLKVRVLGQKPTAKPAPSAEVAALLGNPQPAAKPVASVPSQAKPQAPAQAKGTPATVVSARRMNTAPQNADSAVTARATPHLRPVQPVPLDDHEEKTESIALGAELFDPTGRSRVPDPLMTALIEELPQRPPPPPAPSIPSPPTQPATPIARAEAKKPAPAPAPIAAEKPAKHGHEKHAHEKAAPQQPKRAGHRARPTPSIPPAAEGKGKPHLFVELYWGETRKYASSHPKIDDKKKLVARDDDNAPLPLWGFGTEGSDFVFAEQKGDLFRVFVPTAAAVERRAQDGNFYPVGAESLEVGPGQRRCVTLGTGHAIRFSGDKEMTLVAYVQPALPRPFVNPLRSLPWLVLAFLAMFGSAFMAFAIYAFQPESADFNAKNVPPVAVRLIAPPKKEEKKKIEEKIKELKKEDKKKPEPKVEKPVAKPVPAETKKALKSVEKLVAAGPAMKDLLAAVDKLGSGPGAKNAKNDFKLSGLIGKAPIANAGIGTFGLGGVGGGGMGIKGAELLRGKGGAGIGALGAGNIGKGKVGGAVTSAVSRNIGAQGTIDKEAVAKAINAHLHEVSSCYERALLKEPGLAGKIVLEWQITTSGGVGFAKTKSSTMRSSAVEGCILNSLKTWRFPPAKGAGVVITYPFMFNSVGY